MPSKIQFTVGDVVTRRPSTINPQRMRITRVVDGRYYAQPIAANGKPLMVDNVWTPGSVVPATEMPYLASELAPVKEA